MRLCFVNTAKLDVWFNIIYTNLFMYINKYELKFHYIKFIKKNNHVTYVQNDSIRYSNNFSVRL